MPGKAPNIQLLILDVDGVLTDGSVILDDQGREYRRFNAKDGAAIKWWLRAGRQMAWISGRESPAVLTRAHNLGVQLVFQHALDKVPVYNKLLADLDLSPEQTAYIADDLMDLPIITRCGFAIAVADATEEVRQAADLVTTRPGGRGAVAEAIRLLLKAGGAWESILAKYTRPDH